MYCPFSHLVNWWIEISSNIRESGQICLRKKIIQADYVISCSKWQWNILLWTTTRANKALTWQTYQKYSFCRELSGIFSLLLHWHSVYSMLWNTHLKSRTSVPETPKHEKRIKLAMILLILLFCNHKSYKPWKADLCWEISGWLQCSLCSWS